MKATFSLCLAQMSQKKHSAAILKTQAIRDGFLDNVEHLKSMSELKRSGCQEKLATLQKPTLPPIHQEAHEAEVTPHLLLKEKLAAEMPAPPKRLTLKVSSKMRF